MKKPGILLIFAVVTVLIAASLFACDNKTAGGDKHGGAPKSSDVASSDVPKSSDVASADASSDDRPGGDALESHKYSGEIITETGSPLRVITRWTAISPWGEADYTVHMEMSFEHYTLEFAGKDGLTLNVGSIAHSYNIGKCIAGSNDGISETVFMTFEFIASPNSEGKVKMPFATSIPFLGSYAGVPIDNIAVEGRIEFPN